MTWVRKDIRMLITFISPLMAEAATVADAGFGKFNCKSLQMNL